MTVLPESFPSALQDLLPKWAHFCLYVERFITHELDIELKGKHIVAAVSGGVDSTALLLVLRYLSQKTDFTVSVFHLNHNLRPESADDAAWVISLCDELGIDCRIASEDVSALAEKYQMGLEEAGRMARYTLFRDFLNETGADFIALGHQVDDLAEDVLMRLIRGTGWPGLAGMTGHDADRNIIRPLLMLPKSTLTAFVEHTGISWREDETNADTAMTRNRVRHEILPLIQKENPNFWQSVSRLWKIGRIEESYWDEAIGDVSDFLPNDLLKNSHKALRLKLYKAALDSVGQGQVLAESLFKLDEAWEERKVGAKFQFPGGKSGFIKSEGVVFTPGH